MTQAVARDCMAEAIVMLEREHEILSGGRILLHVHDEVVLDCPIVEADTVRNWVEGALQCVPPWAEGLPLKADVSILERYSK